MSSKKEQREKQLLNLMIRREVALFKKKGNKITRQEDEKVAPNLLVKDHIGIIPMRDDFEIETVFGFEPFSVFQS